MRHLLLCGALLSCLLVPAGTARGDDDTLTLIFGPYMTHFSGQGSRNSFPWFVGLEWESSSRWEIGGAVFRNTYYQPSGYLYGGRRWLVGTPDEHLFFKLTAGALMGYVDPYERKIPVNYRGFGLGIVPAVGYQYGRASTQIVVLGVSGLMLTVGYDLWR